jgi:NADPH:quinone reductase-like Zn-dependent oxidoreductase
VLVAGASGGCGLAAIQIARSLVGSEGKVAAICGTSNVERIQQYGVCDLILDYKSPELLVDKDTSPLKSIAPISCFYDTVSSPEKGDGLNGLPYDVALKSLLGKDCKTVAINGSALRWIRMFLGWQERNFKLFFTQKSSAQLAQIAGWCESKELNLPLDSVHPFDAAGIKAAYDKLKSRRAVGKIAIDVLKGTET